MEAMRTVDEAMYGFALFLLLGTLLYQMVSCCWKELPDQPQDQTMPAPPPPPILPCFPYQTKSGGATGETTVCAICLDELRMGQLCSEVPACQHVFHRDCIATWAKSKGSCPLCRAVIVKGSNEVAAADDMV